MTLRELQHVAVLFEIEERRRVIVSAEERRQHGALCCRRLAERSEDFERILAALGVRGAALHLVAPQILRREKNVRGVKSTLVGV